MREPVRHRPATCGPARSRPVARGAAWHRTPTRLPARGGLLKRAPKPQRPARPLRRAPVGCRVPLPGPRPPLRPTSQRCRALRCHQSRPRSRVLPGRRTQQCRRDLSGRRAGPFRGPRPGRRQRQGPRALLCRRALGRRARPGSRAPPERRQRPRCRALLCPALPVRRVRAVRRVPVGCRRRAAIGWPLVRRMPVGCRRRAEIGRPLVRRRLVGCRGPEFRRPGRMCRRRVGIRLRVSVSHRAGGGPGWRMGFRRVRVGFRRSGGGGVRRWGRRGGRRSG